MDLRYQGMANQFAALGGAGQLAGIGALGALGHAGHAGLQCQNGINLSTPEPRFTDFIFIMQSDVNEHLEGWDE